MGCRAVPVNKILCSRVPDKLAKKVVSMSKEESALLKDDVAISMVWN